MLSERLSEQIGYDYDAAVEKCKKKAEKEKRTSTRNIGGEALELAIGRS